MLLSTVRDASTDPGIWSSMFVFQVPASEKIIRTVLVYAVIAVLIRVFGGRTLAQLNMTDLVVVLLLSNVVQNAIIGADNSVSGGVLGAVVLMATDQLIDRLSFTSPRFARLLQGTPVRLVDDGHVDEVALHKAGLRQEELLNVLHRQGADRLEQVDTAYLQPGGSFDVEVKRDYQNATTGELRDAIVGLQAHLDHRLAAIEAQLARG